MLELNSAISQDVGEYGSLDRFVLNPNLFGFNGNTSKNVMRFHSQKGKNMLDRNQPLLDWIYGRGDAGLFQFGLAWQDMPENNVVAKNVFGRRIQGYNFTSIDYLGLGSDKRLADVAIDAAQSIGVHSVSVGALMGNFPGSEKLEAEMKDWMGYEHCLLFPTGFAASFGAVRGLVRQHDFVVMDEFVHVSLQEGAFAATRNVLKYRHLDNLDAGKKLQAVRAANPDAAIMVITEGMYSMDGDIPDLAELKRCCDAYEATLLVDVCHDLAASGPQGTGTIGLQGLLGQVDVVVGAFSKALGTNGGFMLLNSEGSYYGVRFFGSSYTYSTALSPIQIAIARKAIKIARSDEGSRLRQSLADVSRTFRDGLKDEGFKIYGADDSYIVPLHLGREGFARIAGGRAFEKGVVATVIEFPVVALGAARYRFSMKPSSLEDELKHAIGLTKDAVREAEAMWVLLKQLKRTDA